MKKVQTRRLAYGALPALLAVVGALAMPVLAQDQAVWSTKNTRDGIWDAMYRKKVYATTGSRMVVRFFSGWDFVPVDGKLPAVGSTVDVTNATWTNTIGDAELITVWEDPDFDPKQRAFYYARVIEIPTPRWTAYDAKRFGITMSDEVPMTTQERAYTSPVWYTP